MSIQPYEIEEVVRVSVHQTLKHLGFTVDDPHQLQADMFYLRKKREGADEAIKWAQRSTLATLIGAGLYALWDGVTHLISLGKTSL
jgi:hypothetical protein